MGRLRGLMWLAAGLVGRCWRVGGLYDPLSGGGPASAEKRNRSRHKPSLWRPGPCRWARCGGRGFGGTPVPRRSHTRGRRGRASDAEGRLSSIELSAGEPILAQRSSTPNVVSTDGRAALYLAENEVLMAVPAVDPAQPGQCAGGGRRVDLLVSLDFSTTRDMQDVALPVATEGAAAETSANDEEQNHLYRAAECEHCRHRLSRRSGGGRWAGTSGIVADPGPTRCPGAQIRPGCRWA
jgi:hypothetical protein